jgi:hypothetical protein
MAAIKVTVSEENLISEGEGNGPVNAFDPRAAQGSRKYQFYIKELNLTGYACSSPTLTPRPWRAC